MRVFYNVVYRPRNAVARQFEGKAYFLKELQFVSSQVPIFRAAAVHPCGASGAMAGASIALPAKRSDERLYRVYRRAADRHFWLGAGVESGLSMTRPQHFRGFFFLYILIGFFA